MTTTTTTISAMFLSLFVLPMMMMMNIQDSSSFTTVSAFHHHNSVRLLRRQSQQQQLYQQQQQQTGYNDNTGSIGNFSNEKRHPSSSSSSSSNNNNTGRHDYHLEANSNPTMNQNCRFTEEQIHLLIAKRLEYKKSRNFRDADKILKGLNTNGIYLQDKTRKYRVDGKNHFGRSTTNNNKYVQRGGSYGLNVDLINELVEERSRYKRARHYHESDELTDRLKYQYGVKVNDKKREWSVAVITKNKAVVVVDVNGDEEEEKVEYYEQFDYVPTPLAPRDHATHTMSDELKEVIRTKLQERSAARQNKKYKEADRIRDELVEQFSILIDDRTKEWKIMEDVDDDDDDDPFTKGAQLSQRSAFVQRNGAGTNSHSNDNKEGNNDDSDTSLSSQMSNTEEEEEEEEEENIAIRRRKSFTSNRLAALTVDELKEKLREAKLPVSGRKSELIDRLLSLAD